MRQGAHTEAEGHPAACEACTNDTCPCPHPPSPTPSGPHSFRLLGVGAIGDTPRRQGFAPVAQVSSSAPIRGGCAREPGESRRAGGDARHPRLPAMTTREHHQEAKARCTDQAFLSKHPTPPLARCTTRPCKALAACSAPKPRCLGAAPGTQQTHSRLSLGAPRAPGLALAGAPAAAAAPCKSTEANTSTEAEPENDVQQRLADWGRGARSRVLLQVEATAAAQRR